MTIDIDKLSKTVDLFIKAEFHAIILLFVGAALCLHGQKDGGMICLGAAAGVFKGKIGA